jgi:acetyl-CoA C-acetyltransferase
VTGAAPFDTGHIVLLRGGDPIALAFRTRRAGPRGRCGPAAGPSLGRAHLGQHRRVPYRRAPFTPDGWHDPDMTRAAESLAAHDGITRDRQDAYAALSTHRAAKAGAAGRFEEELVTLPGAAGYDELPRPGFERLLPRFSVLFRGTAPGLAVRAHTVVGCDPALPSIGAAPAVLEALDRAGYNLTQVAAFEIVEAFAAQTLAVLDCLGLSHDDERLCADGGTLGLGHPWGASGAVAVVRLFSRLVRDGGPAGTVGVAAASVGGGIGVAAVFEVVR